MEKPKLPLPGQIKFKLKPMDQPYTDPKTGMQYTKTCPELINPPCPDCINGWMEVAFGQDEQGNFDIYRFRCKCQFTDGYERLQLTGSLPYSERPISYSCHESKLPGHVLIHPIHASKRMAQLKKYLKKRAEELESSLLDDLPF